MLLLLDWLFLLSMHMHVVCMMHTRLFNAHQAFSTDRLKPYQPLQYVAQVRRMTSCCVHGTASGLMKVPTVKGTVAYMQSIGGLVLTGCLYVEWICTGNNSFFDRGTKDLLGRHIHHLVCLCRSKGRQPHLHAAAALAAAESPLLLQCGDSRFVWRVTYSTQCSFAKL